MHRFMSEMADPGFAATEPHRQGGVADENVRWLVGWLDEPEALQALSAGRYGADRSPFP